MGQCLIVHASLKSDLITIFFWLNVTWLHFLTVWTAQVFESDIIESDSGHFQMWYWIEYVWDFLEHDYGPEMPGHI